VFRRQVISVRRRIDRFVRTVLATRLSQLVAEVIFLDLENAFFSFRAGFALFFQRRLWVFNYCELSVYGDWI
jgi:hypothetical protein